MAEAAAATAEATAAATAAGYRAKTSTPTARRVLAGKRRQRMHLA